MYSYFVLRTLVLELVEGPTLADRIAQGPIPVDEALPIAKQIAEALEAAHEQGVIHRDLKPANIKVRDDGTVKVLDFGLAKALDTSPEGDPSQSPTLTAAATQMGVIMGTAAYMSPEQARGKPVDKRADIWSFGVVLYEMLTGQRAFQGEDVSLTLASVMKSDLEVQTLPHEVPATIRTVLRQCLVKDPKKRMRDVGDVLMAMEGTFEITVSPTSVAAVSETRRGVAVPVALVLSLLAAVLGGLGVWVSLRPASAPGMPVRFTVPLPEGDQLVTGGLGSQAVLSPDGRTLVYAAVRDGVQQLYRRDLNQLEPIPISGTENGRFPFISPDGEWVGFEVNGTLRKALLAGGPSVTLYDGADRATDAYWGANDTIVFGFRGNNHPIMQVSGAGGAAQVVTTVADNEFDHRQPQLLPDGSALLFVVRDTLQQGDRIFVQDLETEDRQFLIEGTFPRYVPSGHLLFAREGAVWAMPFDIGQLKVTGDAVPAMEGVEIGGSGFAQIAVAGNGALVYVPDAAAVEDARTLVWVDREGREEPLEAEPRPYEGVRLSPDGSRVATVVAESENTDVLVYDVARGTATRLTFDPAADAYAVWSPDGQRVAFASTRESGQFNLFWKASDGTGDVERLTTSDRWHASSSWVSGQPLVYFDQFPDTFGDISALSIDGDRASELILQEPFNQNYPEVSPDGRWIAYGSNESGQSEIYVRPFPNVEAGKWQVSRDGGTRPVWAPDGRELFYLGLDFLMKVVPVESEPTFSPGIADVLFDARDNLGGTTRSLGRPYDISPDGQRFLMVKEGPASDTTSVEPGITVVLNWHQELLERVPIP